MAITTGMIRFAATAAVSGRLLAIGLVALMAVALSGCETVPAPDGPNPLAQFRLTEVTVDFSRADRPLLVADLDGEISQQISSTTLGAVGTRLGVVNQDGRQAALEQAIRANVEPHVRDAFNPMMQGSRAARAVVTIHSVFIRSRVGLQQLTGARVTVNGQRRPDNAQFAASIVIHDVETGIPVGMAGPITRTDDGTITLAGGGPKAPPYGQSARLNQLVFEFAQGAANVVRREARTGMYDEDDQGTERVIWERRFKL